MGAEKSYIGIEEKYTVKDFFDNTVSMLKKIGSPIKNVTSTARVSLAFCMVQSDPEKTLSLVKKHDASFEKSCDENFSHYRNGTREFKETIQDNISNHIENILYGVALAPIHEQPIKDYLDMIYHGFCKLCESDKLSKEIKASTELTRQRIKELQDMSDLSSFFSAYPRDILTAAIQVGMTYFVYAGKAEECRNLVYVTDEYQKFINPSSTFVARTTRRSAFDSLYTAALEQLHNKDNKTLEPALLSSVTIQLPDDSKTQTADALDEALKKSTNQFEKHFGIRLVAPAGAGKTTQLIQAGLKLMKKESSTELSKNRCVFLYIRADEILRSGNLLESVLGSAPFHATKEEIETLTEAMKNDVEDELQDRYILAIDGLDEVSEERKKWICEETRSLTNWYNLTVIAASRTTEIALFDGPYTIVRLNGLEDKQIRHYLSRNGLSEFAVYDIYKRPMLLQLAVHRQQVFNTYSAEIQSSLTLIPEDEVCGLTSGEVVWNYIQVEIARAVRKGEDRAFLENLLLYVFPAVVYDRFLVLETTVLRRRFFKDALDKQIKENMGSSGIDHAMELLLAMDLIQQEVNGEIRLHQLFRDFFGMIHAANVISGLAAGLDSLTKDQERVLANPLVFDHAENNELMISILPAVLLESGVREPGFKENTIHQLEKEAKKGGYPLFYRSLYPLWCARCFADKQLPPQEFIDKMTQDSFMQLEKLGNNVDSLHPVCAMHIFSILTKVYRSGVLFLQTKYKPKVEALYEDGKLRQNYSLCKKFGYAACHLQETISKQHIVPMDVRFADGHNYLAKAYLSAYDELCYWLVKNPGKEYILTERDIVLTQQDFELLGEFGTEKTSIKEHFVPAGSRLSNDAVKDRAAIFFWLANQWLKKGKKEKSVLAINLLALIEESRQEQLGKERGGDYSEAYKLFSEAAQIKHPTGTAYAQYKCIQYLAEGKKVIENNRKTRETAEKLLDEIAYTEREAGKYLYYKALLQWESKKALPAVLENLEMSFNLYKTMPSFITIFEAVLSANNKEYVDLFKRACRIFLLRKGSQVDKGDKKLYKSGFQAYANSVVEKRECDKWKPSLVIFNETCNRLFDLKKKYRKEIEKLDLRKEIEAIEACVAEEKELLKKEEKWLDEYAFIRGRIFIIPSLIKKK